VINLDTIIVPNYESIKWCFFIEVFCQDNNSSKKTSRIGQMELFGSFELYYDD